MEKNSNELPKTKKDNLFSNSSHLRNGKTNNMIKILKEKFKTVFGGRKKQKTVDVLVEYHNELINKYPNIAIFAFDRIGAEIQVLLKHQNFSMESTTLTNLPPPSSPVSNLH